MKRLLALLLACLLAFGGLLAQEGQPPTDEELAAEGIGEIITVYASRALETGLAYIFPDRNEWGDIFPRLPGLPPPSGGGGGGPINSPPPPPPPPETDEAERCLELINLDVDLTNRINGANGLLKGMLAQGYIEWSIDGENFVALPGDPVWNREMKSWLDFKFRLKKEREEIKDNVEDCLN